MPHQLSRGDERWQFLEKVADDVHRLVFPPASAVNAKRFKAQIEVAIECKRRREKAEDKFYRSEREHRKKVEQDARLQDYEGGPPADGWTWDEDFVWSHEVGATWLEEGAWMPPGFLTRSDLPPDPIPCRGSPEVLPFEIRLMGQYLILAMVHDDGDTANERGRPGLLTGCDLPLSLCRIREHGPYSRMMRVGSFDCVTIKRAREDVTADLEAHLAKVKPGKEAHREAPDAKAPKVPKEMLAVALLARHPDWTDQQIADNVPCHVKTLPRWALFKAAKRRMAAAEMTPPPTKFQRTKSGRRPLE